MEVPEDAENYYSEEISSNDLEPEVTIIKRKDSVKEEYRLNGKLYMVKIIPSVGPAYFILTRMATEFGRPEILTEILPLGCPNG